MQLRPAPDEIVGVIPAGGQAVRIAPLPCSKEIYPIGFQGANDALAGRPKTVVHYLLEKMRSAGVSTVYFVIRPGKWDIPAYFGDGSMLKMHFAYLMLGDPSGVPFTLDQAYPFVERSAVAFGFPDILFDADDAFLKLRERNAAHDADVTLGLTPAAGASSKEDRAVLGDRGVVQDMVLRPDESGLNYSWVAAVWRPGFTQFLHEFVASKKSVAPQAAELSAGHVIRAAIHAGLRVDSVVVSDRPYLDIGTPEGLRRAFFLYQR